MPAHLIVLGGGYIGVEMAQAYRRFGSRVTIVEPGLHIVGREDADVAEEIGKLLMVRASTFSCEPVLSVSRAATESRFP